MEKPIIFGTPMVRAILDGKKTQTRRVIKRRGYDEKIHRLKNDFADKDFEDLWQIGYRAKHRGWPQDSVGVRCPYQPGDILWVRETWGTAYAYGEKSNGKVGMYVYRADGDTFAPTLSGKWRPSIHMPREAARIFLRVTDVRAERVQEISHLDCLAEGIQIDDDTAKILHELDQAVREKRIAPGTAAGAGHLAAVSIYRKLWDDLNAKRGYGWEVNPWVWVYTFERMVGTHDQH